MTGQRQAVMVFGASRGLGRAIAHALADAGFLVGAACRSTTDADAVAGAIAAGGGRAVALTADVTDPAATAAAVARLSEVGEVAGVVNNAGAIDPIGRIADTDPQAWARTVGINLTGAYHGARAALAAFAKGGVVINISSGAAATPMEGWSAYCASKAGLAMLTRVIAHEYGADGVVAYGVRPGLVDTDMQAAIRSSGVNPISQVPREQLFPPEVPARLVAWLMTTRPADLSGQELDVRDAALMARVTGEGVNA